MVIVAEFGCDPGEFAATPDLLKILVPWLNGYSSGLLAQDRSPASVAWLNFVLRFCGFNCHIF